MFCPVCKYEFRRGFTHCNTCDVDLVDALPPEEEADHTPAASGAGKSEQLTRLWTGTDSATYSALMSALDAAGIPYSTEHLAGRSVFTSEFTGLEIWVPADNIRDAQPILDAIEHERSEVIRSDQGGFSDGMSLFPELPDETAEGADDIRHENVTRELHPDDATAEVWSGANETLAEVLKSCLAEIGIACYVERPDPDTGAESDSAARSEPDVAAASGRQPLPFAVRVLPADESRAREIVREVTDAVPPQ